MKNYYKEYYTLFYADEDILKRSGQLTERQYVSDENDHVMTLWAMTLIFMTLGCVTFIKEEYRVLLSM